MRLLIVRHATALPHGTPGIPDNDRPLTPEGELKFREAAKGLARILDRPDALLTSPWLRARQTAAIAAAAWGGPEPKETAALASGSFDAACSACWSDRGWSPVAGWAGRSGRWRCWGC